MPSRDPIRHSVNQRLKNSSWRKYAFEALEILDSEPKLIINFENGKTCDIPFTDVYCQGFRQDLITFEDMILTAIAWQKILNGKTIYRFIEVREPPHSDKDISPNKAILADMIKHYGDRGLHHIKNADFWGGNQGADGFIEFLEPFIGNFSGCATDSTEEVKKFALANPIHGRCTYFPLEVGYCMPDQIEMHLSTTRCIARFPYDSRFIIFMENVS